MLVVYPDDTADDSMVDFASYLGQRIVAWTGNEGHIFNATRSWLRDSIERADPVVTSVRRDAVAVIGPEFEQLLRALEAEKLTRA